ncbi:MAG: type IV toxin-antitoxin system AbiEi family antitoxin [Gammaproteobacteria bacterium]
MNKIEAIQVLRTWDQQGKYVFTHGDLRKLFLGDKDKAFNEGLARLVKAGLLIRACRGVYVNPYALSQDSHTIEHIAKALRRGEFNYVSLESVLSECGAISQILLDRLTVMTTGREGTYLTPYGTIEFTHTRRSTADILEGMHSVPHRPLRVASKETAWRDLKRVGRNINMVDTGVFDGE